MFEKDMEDDTIGRFLITFHSESVSPESSTIYTSIDHS